MSIIISAERAASLFTNQTTISEKLNTLVNQKRHSTLDSVPTEKVLKDISK